MSMPLDNAIAYDDGGHQKLTDYLLRDECFRELRELQDKGWSLPQGDEHFNQRRERADKADSKGQKVMFSIMKRIGYELHRHTKAFTIRGNDPTALDLCMAPGGFTNTVLQKNPQCSVDAFTLPTDGGGHEVLIKFGSDDSRVRVHFTDITMFSKELGFDEIPEDHPDRQKLLDPWPYETTSYDLVICDGKTQEKQPVADYRKGCEASRLINSQLLLGLRKIKPGGTMVVLLHRAYCPRVFRLVHEFCGFSRVKLFKPKVAHKVKSSFYMVAKDIQPHSREAEATMKLFGEAWSSATFQQPQTSSHPPVGGSNQFDSVHMTMIEDFGPEFVRLARPIWKVQAKALKEADWMN